MSTVCKEGTQTGRRITMGGRVSVSVEIPLEILGEVVEKGGF